ncbi:MAG: hypothetical protein SGJ24_01885 [Chloroflexota bacterium]|nr:hypothetical protein [Chloroflexota bacterium]
MDDLIVQGELSPWVSLSQHQGEAVYEIADTDLKQIRSVLDLTYSASVRLPLLRCAGGDYVKWINRAPEANDLFARVHDTFNGILNPGTVRNVEILVMGDGVLMLRGLRDDWRFLIVVAPNSGALSIKDINQLCGSIQIARERIQNDTDMEDDMRVLLLAPDSDDIQTYNAIAAFPYIYHLWAWSLVRFLHLFELEFKTADERSRIAKEFIAIFPLKRRSPISEINMIERLREKKSPSSS